MSHASETGGAKPVFYRKTDLAGVPADWKAEKDRQARAWLPGIVEAAPLFCGEAPVSIELLPGLGTFHALYRIVLRSGERRILRASLPPEPAVEFHIDPWAMRAMEERGLPFLKIHTVDLSRRVLPFDFEVMAEAAGRTLQTFEDLESQAVAEPLLFALGAALGGIHRIETTGFGPLDAAALAGGAGRGSGALRSWREYIGLNLGEHLEVCRAIGAISAGELARIWGEFDRAGEALDRAPSRLLHGDPGHHNVFSDGRGITAIIDWEDALCGDPVFDAAYWGTFCRDGMREPFLAGYRSALPLPEDFERRYWLYYLRIAISKTVHRSRFGQADAPGRPPASARIQKGLARVEAEG